MPMSEFRMPSLGASMEAGTLVSWQKAPGDVLRRGDIIAVVDTEKGAIEIEVFEDGVLEEIRVQPGEEVPVGTVLALIRDQGAPPEAPAEPPAVVARPEVVPADATGASGAPSAPGAPGEQAAPAAAAAAVAVSPPPAPPRASPAARSLARELGIDLAAVKGTGEGGVIVRADVERAAETAPVSPTAPASVTSPIAPMAPTAPALPTSPTPPAPRTDTADRMRQAIAGAMAQSKREIPHFYLGATVDMHRALTWLAEENARRSVEARLLPAALLIKATALAFRECPAMNGHWVDGAFRAGRGIHPGVAISLRGGGLVAPAIHDADTRDLSSLMEALRDLVVRARGGGLRSSELTDATFTITNLGEQGVEVGYGIIYPPQVALVSFGRIADQPVAVDGQVVIRPVVRVTISADHRAVDGHLAGLCLAAIGRHLQEPLDCARGKPPEDL